MTTPIELVIRGTDRIACFVCATCHLVSSPLHFVGEDAETEAAAREAARQCCEPRVCACGATIPEKYRTECGACQSKRWNEESATKEAAAFAKATKIPLAEYGGEMVTDGEEWFGSTTDVDEDSCANEAADGTRYLWATMAETPQVDLEDELENWLQDHHEDARERVDFKKLAKATAMVNKALQPVRTFRPDWSIAIVLPEETT